MKVTLWLLNFILIIFILMAFVNTVSANLPNTAETRNTALNLTAVVPEQVKTTTDGNRTTFTTNAPTSVTLIDNGNGTVTVEVKAQ